MEWMRRRRGAISWRLRWREGSECGWIRKWRRWERRSRICTEVLEWRCNIRLLLWRLFVGWNGGEGKERNEWISGKKRNEWISGKERNEWMNEQIKSMNKGESIKRENNIINPWIKKVQNPHPPIPESTQLSLSFTNLLSIVSIGTNKIHTTELERSRMNNLSLEWIDVDPKYIANVQQIEEKLTYHRAKGQRR